MNLELPEVRPVAAAAGVMIAACVAFMLYVLAGAVTR